MTRLGSLPGYGPLIRLERFDERLGALFDWANVALVIKCCVYIAAKIGRHLRSVPPDDQDVSLPAMKSVLQSSTVAPSSFKSRLRFAAVPWELLE